LFPLGIFIEKHWAKKHMIKNNKIWWLIWIK
jgi:hypothetical protein